MNRVKLLIIILTVFLSATYFTSRKNIFRNENVVTAQTKKTPSPSTGGCFKPPQITSAIPSDMASNSQADANCFAWQEFIALNWQADPNTCSASGATPATQFGEPNNTAPVTWESYKQASEVFLPDAQPPSGWCAQQSVPLNLTKAKISRLEKTSRLGYKFLTADSKDDENPAVKIAKFQQAGDNSWLTSQSGYLTMYEVKINADEFNFINQNKLYNAANQQAFARSNTGFNLPDGTSGYSKYGNTGAIELKAAWLELDDSSQWKYYKTSKAYVVYPTNPTTPKLVTVGLVGLHIIHKTANGQQFIWATFEHINNAPSSSDINSKNLLPQYTYYNANCNPNTDHYQCKQNAQVSPTPYFPHQPNDAYNAPIQVVRTTPISTDSTNNIAGLNQYAWGIIKNANADSVFLNYQLVNVLWSNNNTPIVSGATTPLTSGDPQPNPGVQPVANTTMETYLQAKTCLSCHVLAPIAAAVNQTKSVGELTQMSKSTASTPVYASDYSFLFSRAKTPPASKKFKTK